MAASLTRGTRVPETGRRRLQPVRKPAGKALAFVLSALRPFLGFPLACCDPPSPSDCRGPAEGLSQVYSSLWSMILGALGKPQSLSLPRLALEKLGAQWG